MALGGKGFLLFARLIFRPLLRDRTRTTLTTFAVALGVAVVIAMDLAGQSAAEGFQESVAVPIEDANSLARLDPDFAERRRKAPNPVPDLAVGEAFSIAIDNLLIRRLQQRRMPQLLQQQRICAVGHVASGIAGDSTRTSERRAGCTFDAARS